MQGGLYDLCVCDLFLSNQSRNRLALHKSVSKMCFRNVMYANSALAV